MDAANSVEEFMSAHDGRYEGLKEVIYKEGHRQARTHLEHHQLLNLMNLLEKEQGAVKSFKKWFARAKKKEALFALKEERRKQLYSQERSRGASGEGFRVRKRGVTEDRGTGVLIESSVSNNSG